MTNGAAACLVRIAQLQNVAADRLAVQEAVDGADASQGHQKFLSIVVHELHLQAPQWLAEPDPARVPALLYSEQTDSWGILRGLNGRQEWITEWWVEASNAWDEQACDSVDSYAIAIVGMQRPFSASKSPVYQLIRNEMFSRKRLLIDGLLGAVVINTVALATSFYTMQVYDRVIPTASTQTLLVLTLGVLIAIAYEWLAKRTRRRIFETLVDHVDRRLSRSVYLRFLNVRLDQLPQSVGGLAAQMRGYETVRGFLASLVSRIIVDAPFALLYIGVIAAIAGQIALIPLVFLVLSAGIGWIHHRRVDALAMSASEASHFKMGLLVESVEGAETIKSGQGGWRMLSRWMGTTDEARGHELRLQAISESSTFLASAFQQASFIGIIASGALLVSGGELTLGGLIACSILSGRVLSMVASVPAQLVQWAHTKAALRGLDKLWALEEDHAEGSQPVVLENLTGDYQLENVTMRYGDELAFSSPGLRIRPGERVGIIGQVGAGKSSLLRLLSGMYKPESGRLLLDGVDLAQIAKTVLAEQIAYVQQDGRMFAGTLRENLTLGLLDPGDDALLTAARATGLYESVIRPHGRGLAREIHEGGSGLSAGQRQLVSLTRALLRNPKIWLLDEPTASMDSALAAKALKALADAVEEDDTLVIVTHKLELLHLVDRVIVVANHRVMLDGARDKVLDSLRDAGRKAVAKAS